MAAFFEIYSGVTFVQSVCAQFRTTNTRTHTPTVIIATSFIIRHQNKKKVKCNLLCIIYQYSHHIQSSVRASFGSMSIVLCVCSHRGEIAPERQCAPLGYIRLSSTFCAVACLPTYRLHSIHKRNCFIFNENEYSLHTSIT